jgi:hypothetical protein
VLITWSIFNLGVELSQGRRNRGGAGGAAAPVALYQEGQRCSFNLKDCLGEIVNQLSEMLVQFFYEFASEKARNAVIEIQEMQSSRFKNSTIAWQRTPSHPYHPINRKHD